MSVVKDVEINHQGVTFKFQIKLMAEGQTPQPPAPPQTIDTLKIVKVTTSADDGNKGDNMLKDDTSRWSCEGRNCIATFDLGAIQQVGEVHVRFFKGSERTESFEISLSTDGQNWLGKLTGEQQNQAAVVLGITPFFNARYVRFVGQGNNKNDWNSIEYVEIKGKKLAEPEEPKPQPQPQPEPTPEPTPTPTPTGDKDKYGIKKIYPDTAPEKVYYEIKGGDLEQHGDYRREWEIWTPPYTAIEVTGIFKVAIKREDTISFKLKGAKHTGPEPQYSACANIHYVPFSGTGKYIGKQCPHLNYKELKGPTPKFTLGDIRNKEIGFKAIEWNEGSNVHWQTWVDEKLDNNWKLWIDFVETKGSIGDDKDTETPFTKSPWSGKLPPTILIRVDFPNKTDSVEARNISAREINVSATSSSAMKNLKKTSNNKKKKK